MREINVSEITETVRDACIKANKILPPDLVQLIFDGVKMKRRICLKI